MLPDILAPGLKLVIVGTAAGETSAARGHYYAGPGNDFWALMYDSGLVPERLGPADDHRLPEHGIGLTDLNKTVAQSHDRGLTYDVDGFVAKIAEVAPAWVAFHGKTAAKAYTQAVGAPKPALGELAGDIAGARVFVLPSASGANRRATYDGRRTRLEWWAELAEELRPENVPA